MIQGLKIKNRNLMSALDRLAENHYKMNLPYKKQPEADVSLATLRTLKAEDNPKVQKTNSHDFTNRFISRDQKYFYKIFLGLFNRNNNTSWWIDEMSVQPPAWGWTSWNNNKNKPKRFFRFIHNAGEGYSQMVFDGKWKKIPDQHSVYNKDWTCLYGVMDGEQWFSDRNLGNTPRFVVEIAIENDQYDKFNIAKELINNV